LRKKIAEKMHESWSTIPHVTQNDEVDVTDLMKVIKNHAASYEKAGRSINTYSGYS
jgi:pyruvate/2-oxoglutarate dehydrogenase complex dihydrolipoamide acyltransferase (E2) component